MSDAEIMARAAWIREYGVITPDDDDLYKWDVTASDCREYLDSARAEIKALYAAGRVIVDKSDA